MNKYVIFLMLVIGCKSLDNNNLKYIDYFDSKFDLKIDNNTSILIVNLKGCPKCTSYILKHLENNKLKENVLPLIVGSKNEISFYKSNKRLNKINKIYFDQLESAYKYDLDIASVALINLKNSGCQVKFIDSFNVQEQILDLTLNI